MTKKYMFLIVLFFVATASAQKKTNSIYSAYGIGDFDMRDNNAYFGMGSVGIAMPSDRTINDLNPAALAGIANYKIQLEIGITGKKLQYLTADNTRINAGDFGIKRAAFGINLFKNIGTAFVLKRFSEVEYLTSGQKGLFGTTVTFPDAIEGTGGLYQASIGNGFKIGNNLSLGFSFGYIFGSINKKETVTTSSTDGVIVEGNSYYDHLSLNTGLQYKIKTGKLNWILGGTFQPGMNLNKTQDDYIKNAAGTILYQDETKTTNFKFPKKIGAGIAVARDKWKLSADYIQQNWGSTGYKGAGFTTKDAGSLSAGLSYQVTKKTLYGLEDGLTFYGGFIHEKSYLDFYNYRLTSTAGTAGLTFPTFHGAYRFSLGLKVGQRGAAIYPLAKETFAELLFNISLNTFMLKGGRKYD